MSDKLKKCTGCKEWWPYTWIDRGAFYDLCPECLIDYKKGNWKGCIPNYPEPKEPIYHTPDIVGIIDNTKRRKPTWREKWYIRTHKFKVKYG